MMKRLMAIALLIGCPNGPDAEPTHEKPGKCSVGWNRTITAVSCYGAHCLVCSGDQCDTFALADCL